MVSHPIRWHACPLPHWQFYNHHGRTVLQSTLSLTTLDGWSVPPRGQTVDTQSFPVYGVHGISRRKGYKCYICGCTRCPGRRVQGILLALTASTSSFTGEMEANLLWTPNNCSLTKLLTKYRSGPLNVWQMFYKIRRMTLETHGIRRRHQWHINFTKWLCSHLSFLRMHVSDTYGLLLFKCKCCAR